MAAPDPLAPPKPLLNPGVRLRFLDLLRALASHLIVLHHLVFYGPLADVAYPLLPATFDWLHRYGRMAVQVFLVAGGFVAAQGLGRAQDLDLRGVLGQAGKRYRRIGGPYLVALLLAVLANEVARRGMSHTSISGPPSLPQLVAHAVFLQDVLGFEALTAGIWYLAIDFQMGLLVLGLFALGGAVARRLRVDAFTVVQALLWPLALLSLFWFNRHPHWDVWAPYFLGSYFLGMLLNWALTGRMSTLLFWLYVGTLLASLGVEWRPRLGVALLTAVVILLAAQLGKLETWPGSPLVARLGAVSYAVFLVHFPVCLVVQAWTVGALRDSPAASLVGMAGAYGLSVAVGVAFHRWVETPLAGR